MNKKIYSKIEESLQKGEEICWINDKKIDFSAYDSPFETSDIDNAENRLHRFLSYIQAEFPEVKDGIIESPLQEISQMKNAMNEKYNLIIKGRLMIKRDDLLPIAGSVKARGGIYEILKYAEKLAIENNLITPEDDYIRFREPKFKELFSKYTVQVGSTGNLGLSIGIMSAAMGFNAVVHMSDDAKEWKKKRLRDNGVKVIEHTCNYEKAVDSGRKESANDKYSYFVDDERSKDLFLGYSVAGRRLKKQLCDMKIQVNEKSPLFVYIPCGIGGAPGGITYGLKTEFGDNVHCFFVEPTNAPCMLLGMVSGLHDKICVQDIGISGKTEADGLAVGRPSMFIGKIMDNILSGLFTVKDNKLVEYLKLLYNTENIYLEPSATAAFKCIEDIMSNIACLDYLNKHKNIDVNNITHIVWATGGKFVPEEIKKQHLNNMN
ncbi:D-serine ammonia-lyase [Abyssisolibacter fermentans]|uniref:D-serine ammonia-lyase n=1 Tax=Abyssisolibacter fermentans TaxID=1766203 RepID=UPI000A4812CD